MITYVVGDLFTSPAKVLVNTVNTVGVMGKGIAKDFKRIYPEMFKRYQYFCKQGMIDIGKLWLYDEEPPKWILNFPTKKHWRGKSKIDYIEDGLRKFADTYDEKGIESISFPMLGCGNGELVWEEVQPLMEEYLADLPIDTYIHLYGRNDLPVLEQRGFEEKRKWLQGEPQYPPFAEFWDDVKELILSEQKNSLKQEALPGFEAEVDSPKPNEHSEATISKDIIEELWELMKSEGYIRIDNFPDAMKGYTSFLQNLTYIQPVWLSDQPEVTDEDLGLQLIPKVSERKTEPQKMLM